MYHFSKTKKEWLKANDNGNGHYMDLSGRDKSGQNDEPPRNENWIWNENSAPFNDDT